MLLARFKILGHSMQPTLSNGQIVLVSSIPYFFRGPKVGDIIAFQKNKKILIKRITEREHESFIVAGDNKNDSLDSKQFGMIGKSEIVGKVLYSFS